MRLEEIVKIISNKDAKFAYYSEENLFNKNNIVYIDVLNIKQRG